MRATRDFVTSCGGEAAVVVVGVIVVLLFILIDKDDEEDGAKCLSVLRYISDRNSFRSAAIHAS